MALPFATLFNTATFDMFQLRPNCGQRVSPARPPNRPGTSCKVPEYEQAEGKFKETIFLHHALIPADFVLTFIATKFGLKHARVRTVPLQTDGYSRNPRNT
jgi:hypothetical protein